MKEGDAHVCAGVWYTETQVHRCTGVLPLSVGTVFLKSI